MVITRGSGLPLKIELYFQSASNTKGIVNILEGNKEENICSLEQGNVFFSSTAESSLQKTKQTKKNKQKQKKKGGGGIEPGMVVYPFNLSTSESMDP